MYNPLMSPSDFASFYTDISGTMQDNITLLFGYFGATGFKVIILLLAISFAFSFFRWLSWEIFHIGDFGKIVNRYRGG